MTLIAIDMTSLCSLIKNENVLGATLASLLTILGSFCITKIQNKNELKLKKEEEKKEKARLYSSYLIEIKHNNHILEKIKKEINMKKLNKDRIEHALSTIIFDKEMRLPLKKQDTFYEYYLILKRLKSEPNLDPDTLKKEVTRLLELTKELKS